MPQVKQPKKRLVTRQEYIYHRAAKASWRVSAIVLFVIGIIATTGLLVFLFLPRYGSLNLYQLLERVLSGLVLLLFGLPGGWWLFKRGMLHSEKAEQIEDVELLTHDTMRQLPAQETLVRASTEPTVKQEKVLLRATIAPEETPSEQLLRPGNVPE